MSAPTTLELGEYTRFALGRGKAGWEPRHLDERRMLYGPQWDRQIIAVGQQQEVQFFVNRSPNRLVSNSDQAGSVNVYESFMVTRILFFEEYGASEADLLELWNNCLFEFTVQNDRAYELLMQPAQPGLGVVGGSIVAHGTPITGYAQDLGAVIVGGGVKFNITIKFPRGRLNNAAAMNLVCQLEAMKDIAVG